MKHCISCGRPIDNIKKSKIPEIKYCSKLCSKEQLQVTDKDIDYKILHILSTIKNKNICSLEMSKIIYKENWKKNYQKIKKSCRRLYLSKQILISQKKNPIKSLNFIGDFSIKPNR